MFVPALCSSRAWNVCLFFIWWSRLQYVDYWKSSGDLITCRLDWRLYLKFMELYSQCLQKQSVIVQCDLTKEAYVPNIYLMSGDRVKEKQTHTLFGQIELLASCRRHACVVRTQQLQQNSFQMHSYRKTKWRQTNLFVVLAVSMSCWLACNHIMFFFTRWFMRLTHTTWFYVNIMLTIRGFTNPKQLFLKDDTSLYLVVVKLCWQLNISKGHFQVVFTQCDHSEVTVR